MLGFKGIRVDKPDDIGAAWDLALTSDRPVVIEFITDPDVPPLPPHITWEQAKALMGTLRKGDPDEGGIIKQSAKQLLASFGATVDRSEEHTSELQSLMRTSYAAFCLKKK